MYIYNIHILLVLFLCRTLVQARSIIEEKMAQHFSKFYERYQPTDSRNLTNAKQDKHKEKRLRDPGKKDWLQFLW